MRPLLAVLVLYPLAAWAQPEPTPRQRAATSVKELSQLLQQLLGEELKRGGFDAAVKACSESAQLVTEEFARDAKLDLRRVSLKYRNPKNQPDDYESARLRQWESQPASMPAEHSEIVTENGRRYLRYMKPIPIQGMCLSCHGPRETLSGAVRDTLDERYPRDKATGYKAGQLRGAFTVIVPLNE